jgi:hypothetical protein
MIYLTGRDLCRLMRRHHVSIRSLSARMQIPMVRIRWRRQHGIEDRHVARDWLEAITGQDPGRLAFPFTLEDRR